MNILEGLNEKQKEAVTSIDGNIRVTAGAGSGKTRVIAHRYAFLVNEVGINPSNILCMTFTNKAAQEMKTRIAKMVLQGNVNDFVCTIHGFCVKFLREEIFRIGYPKNFVILDKEDAKDIAKQVMDEFGINKDTTNVKQILDGIRKNKYWHRTYIEEDLLPNANNKDINIFTYFLKLQLKSFALDFDDLILVTIYILKKWKDVRDKWQERLNYIMVDEAQDCSQTEWELINYLQGEHHNLFYVGDPDQCIYEWRGAAPDLFIKSKSDKDIILAQNYRSTPNILDVANSVISHNKNRIKKNLFTEKPKDKKAIYYHAPTEADEGKWIAKQIKGFVKRGAKYSDFAVLYRANYQSRSIEQALLQEHIEYSIWGGVRFFERKEIKDALAYLRLLVYHDDISFRRIINVPSRKFGPQSLTTLTKLSEEETSSLYNTLSKHFSEFVGKGKLLEFITLFDNANKFKEEHSISDTLDFLITKSGYKDMLRLDSDEDRIDNLEELLNSIKYYEETNKDNESLSIDNYLQDIALYTNADYKKEGSTVKLMTIHQSKGLEFPYVFVCGLTEGIFPSHRSIRERKEKALEEERRLMYVAITRAERLLFLTESEGYNFVTKQEKYPSRFLNEIKDSLLQVKGHVDESLLEGTKQLVQRLELELNNNQKITLKQGEIVSNEYFGTGEIISVNQEDGTCKVKFANGIRSIFANKLKKVEVTNVSTQIEKNGVTFQIGDLVSNKYFGLGKIISVNKKDKSCKVNFNTGNKIVSNWALKKADSDFVVKEKLIVNSAKTIPFLYVCDFPFYNSFSKKIEHNYKYKKILHRNEGYKAGTYQISLVSEIYKDNEETYHKLYIGLPYPSNNKFHIGSLVKIQNELFQILKIVHTYPKTQCNRYLLSSFKDGSFKEFEESKFGEILITPIIGGCYKFNTSHKYAFLKDITYDRANTIFHILYSDNLRSHKIALDKFVLEKPMLCTEDTFLRHCTDKKKYHEIVNKMQK